MERILTNYQVEWLSNLKALSKYEDKCYEKNAMVDKVYNFIENNYPGQENEVVPEFEVLRQKNFIILESEIDKLGDYVISEIDITKAGSDYLILLEEDWQEKMLMSDRLTKINEILISISKSSSKMSMKGVLDKIEQITTIGSNLTSVAGSLMSLGTISQGLIPIVRNLIGI
jgi:hypothetical protein